MTRQRFLDVIGGLMVIWMIMGHVISSCGLKDSSIYLIGNRLLPFFMAWFFYKSGMLYQKKDTLKMLVGGGKRLLVPYVSFCLLTFMIFHLHHIFTDGLVKIIIDFVTPIINTGAPGYNIALWFLLTLFLVKLLFDAFLKMGITPIVIGLVSAIICISIQIAKNQYQDSSLLVEPYYLYNTISGVFFYSVGYLLKDIQYKKPVLIVSIIAHVLIISLYFSFVDMFKNTLLEGSYLFWMMSGVTGCVIINNVFKIIVCHYTFPILNYIGVNSMSFFAMHIWVIIIMKEMLFPIMHVENSYLKFSILIIAISLFIPIANQILHTKQLSWIIGENR